MLGKGLSWQFLALITFWTVHVSAESSCDALLRFHPSVELAQSRPVSVEVPQADPLILRMMTPIAEQIKWFQGSLSGRNATMYKTAVESLCWLMRFHEDPTVRRQAVWALYTNTDGARASVSQMIAAQLHETDPQVKALLGEAIEKTLPGMEAHFRAGRTPLKLAAPDITANLSPEQRGLVMNWMEAAFTVRAPFEAKARLEQIPAEIAWLEQLRENSSRSSQDLQAYQSAVQSVLQRRTELADLLFRDQILYLFFYGLADIVEVGENSAALNDKMFSGLRPPFTPDKPYVRLRIKEGQSLNLCRTYGGGAQVGGAFFFACRDTAMKTKSEARDMGALPNKNTSEFWRKVSFSAGEEFYLGSINPQYSPTGETLPDFGYGGLGGEIQFWRPPGRPYFTDQQMGTEVPTIEDYQLQQMQGFLRSSANDYGDHNWYHALKIYQKVKADNDASPEPQRSEDLKNAWTEIQRFHRAKYVNYLNLLLSDLGTNPVYDARTLYATEVRVRQNLWDRDKLFNPSGTPGALKTYDWTEAIEADFTAKYQAYFATGEKPTPLVAPPY